MGLTRDSVDVVVVQVDLALGHRVYVPERKVGTFGFNQFEIIAHTIQGDLRARDRVREI